MIWNHFPFDRDIPFDLCHVQDQCVLSGQTDLVIKEAREAKIEEYLTTSFKSSLHAAAKDRESRRDKNREDKLLHHRLDKLVKEEARTNNKVWFYA